MGNHMQKLVDAFGVSVDFAGHMLFGIRFELEVKADVFRLLGVEVILDGGADFFVEVGDAFVGFVCLVGFDEWHDVADFGFDANTVAIFLGDATSESVGGALEVTEGFGEGFVTAAEDPVDDFALAHDIEVVDGKVAAVNHGLNHVGEELEGSAGAFVVVMGGEAEVLSGEVGGEFRSLEGELVDTAFVFGDDNVIVEAFDLVKIPDVVIEIAMHESVFETIGGKVGQVVIGNGVEMIIGNFAG